MTHSVSGIAKLLWEDSKAALQQFEVTRLDMDKDNRKLGLRGGLEKTRGYIRLDLWGIGWRITKKEVVK